MAYQHNSTAQSASDKAIEKFTEMMINRLEEAKDNDWKRGWIGGQGFQGLPQNLNGATIRAPTHSSCLSTRPSTSMQHQYI